MSKEMDRSDKTRPGTKKQSQITKNTFGNLPPVPRDSSDHAQNSSQQKASNLGQTALLARTLPIDMTLPGDESVSHELILSKAKWRKARRIATKSVALAVVLVITLSGLIFSQSYLKLHKVFHGATVNAAGLKQPINPNLLKGQESGRVNILLLGRDGGNKNTADLTNTVIVASIDTLNHTATILSVPSDLWVNVPGGGVMKINGAFQNGEFNYLGKALSGSTDPKALMAGFSLADQTLSQVLGINIDYNAVVNMSALSQAVDTVGGISVSVPADLNDPTMAWQNKGNPVLVHQGTQILNGKQALLYVMSKETTSESAREERQREVLTSLFSKITSMSTLSDPSKLINLINTFGNNVFTDLSLKNAQQLYGILSSVDSSNITSIDLSTNPNQLVTTGNMNGLPITLPKAGLFNYGAIQQYLKSQLKNPFTVKENARVLILNGTNTPGLATNFGSVMRNEGYNILGEANTPQSGWNKSVIYALNKSDIYTQKALQQKLHFKIADHAINKSIPTDGADFVIILGNDEANLTQTQAN